jgi:hypothetical protein
MATHHYPFRLATEASIDLAQDQELLDLMIDANFRTVLSALKHQTPIPSSDAEVPKYPRLLNRIRPKLIRRV